MQNRMNLINEHASQLAKFLHHTEDPYVWRHVAEWLSVASGIVRVRFDTIRFDEDHGMCSPADEFNAAREQLLQRYVTELTRFTYCWVALECAVDTIAPSKALQRGKINGACYYIQQHSPDDKGVLYYWDVLDDFRQTLVDSGETNTLKRFRSPSFVSIRSLALYVIYSIRNKFAHGVLHLPIPDSENRPRSHHVQLIEHASRLTLMSIQHLLAAAHKTYVHTWKATLDDGELVEHEFHPFLSSLHVKKPPINNNRRLI